MSNKYFNMQDKSYNIYNVAIVAHVDHGKTTFVDNVLKSIENVVDSSMDSNDIERERGITILAKCTGIYFEENKINIIDTPGHADFGGEVERVMCMVNTVILVVDSVEGVKAQTRFVLEKAVNESKKRKFKIILIINKMDRDGARPDDVLLDTLDVIHSMGYNVDSIPVLYASGREGWVVKDINDERNGFIPLLNEILNSELQENRDNEPFRMFVSIIDYDKSLGKNLLIGRVDSGTIKVNQEVKVLDMENNQIDQCRVTNLFTFRGNKKIREESIRSNDIVAIVGPDAFVTHTICGPGINESIIGDKISPPTMSVIVRPNDGPMAGKDGNKLTANKIKERLIRESQSNVSIQVKEHSGGIFEVYCRGELGFCILLEEMRREGYEVVVETPKVLFKGNLEPIEKVQIICNVEHIGIIVQELNQRRAEILSMDESSICCKVPTRGLIGFHSFLVAKTRGTASMDREFIGYEDNKGEINVKKHGSIISMENGIALAYDLNNIQERGYLFISPGTEVYKGMIIGEHSKSNNLEVNPTRGKRLTNMRAAGKDDAIILTPPRRMSMEECLSHINDEEALEVTPMHIRLRMKNLK